MKTKLSVILVDDHKLFREGLKLLLSNVSLIETIYEASDGQNFIDQLNNIKPDLALLDIEMPVMNGIEAMGKIRNIKINIPVNSP